MKEEADNMNLKTKGILIFLLLVVISVLAAGCAPEATPYEINDADGYTVSVKYDANGGTFTTNTSVIIDSYNVSEMQTNGDGNVEIALLSPDNSLRGNDAFTAINNGHFLAGWYTQRTETTDSQGNTVYTYSGLWDFETDLLTVDPSEAYSSQEPVVTLYAAWVPLFTIEFYDLDSGEYLDSYVYNPMTAGEILVPEWDDATGAIEMYDFPERKGYTYENAFYDAEGTKPVDTAEVVHSGAVDYETGTAQDHTMRLYVRWTEGEWFHIYNVEQFLDNASVSGNYVLHADLDFTGEIWPSSLMYGNFSGSIQGNGHTIRNVTLEQTNNSKVNAGLFGHLTETAAITDLTLENVTFTIKNGTRVVGTSYGLFAGTVSGEATVSGVSIVDSTLQIDSGCYFGTDEYAIGLVCGMGSVDIDPTGITAAAVGDNTERVVITVTDQTVTVEFLTE